jgi:hypothetical protein
MMGEDVMRDGIKVPQEGEIKADVHEQRPPR